MLKEIKGAQRCSKKKRLLEAGVIDEPVAGKFVFALPGVAKYLQEKR